MIAATKPALRLAAVILISLAVFLLLPAFARADNINFAGAFDQIGQDISRWINNRVLGFFTVIIVESIVFRQLLGLSWGRCIGISVVINFFSAFVGVIIAFISSLYGPGGLTAICFALALALIVMRTWSPPRWFWATAIITILLGAPVVLLNPYASSTSFALDLPIIYLTLFHMLLGFGTTLLTESVALSIFFKRVIVSWSLDGISGWKVILIANICSYICIIPFFLHTPPFRYYA